MADAFETRALDLADRLLQRDLPPSEWAAFLASAYPDDPALCRRALAILEALPFDDEAPPALSLPVSDDAPAQTAGDPLIGQCLADKYWLDALVPVQGGMGRVYRGTWVEGEARTPVAIKVLRPGFGSQSDFARFRREWEIQ